jgi:predicted GIY-YIG superfamily endonuclease
MKTPWYVYILKCADGSYYTGSTNDLSRRLGEHQDGVMKTSYTFSRRPVTLVWSSEASTRLDALNFERQIKGWSRIKKEALIHGNWDEIHKIVTSERKRREKK